MSVTTPITQTIWLENSSWIKAKALNSVHLQHLLLCLQLSILDYSDIFLMKAFRRGQCRVQNCVSWAILLLTNSDDLTNDWNCNLMSAAVTPIPQSDIRVPLEWKETHSVHLHLLQLSIVDYSDIFLRKAFPEGTLQTPKKCHEFSSLIYFWPITISVHETEACSRVQGSCLFYSNYSVNILLSNGQFLLA